MRFVSGPLLLALAALAASACHRGNDGSDCSRSVDRSSLADTTKCFYASTLAGGGIKLLSQESRKQMTPEAYRQGVAGLKKETAALHPEILGETDLSRGHFARVSVTMDKTAPEPCTEVVTDTWVREAEGWARVATWGAQPRIAQLRAANRLTDALAVVDEWLAREPYSTRAYDAEMQILAALGDRMPPEKKAFRNDFVRSLLAINPADTTAVDYALEYSADPAEAKTLFHKLPESACGLAFLAYRISARLPDAQDALQFLSTVNGDDPTLILARMEALTRNKQRDLAATMLIPETTEKLRKLLEGAPAAFAAEEAAHLGKLAAGAGRFDQAEMWITLGMGRDPGNHTLEMLAATLPKNP